MSRDLGHGEPLGSYTKAQWVINSGLDLSQDVLFISPYPDAFYVNIDLGGGYAHTNLDVMLPGRDDWLPLEVYEFTLHKIPIKGFKSNNVIVEGEVLALWL